MPQRTNWFQRLIHAIEENLAPEEASVRESEMLLDRVIGEEREVDIVIRTSAGTHDLTLGVECVGGTVRPADVTWVEKIASKHEHLPIDRTILVSRTGFSANARKKAEALRMETLSLSEALHHDWTSELRSWPKFFQIKRTRPIAVHVLLDCPTEEDQERLRTMGQGALERAVFFSPGGSAVGTASEIAHGALNRPDVQARYGEFPVPGNDDLWVVPLELEDLAGGFFMDQLGNKVTIARFRVVGIATYETSEVPWERRAYGPAEVAYAQLPFEDQTVTIVATEVPGKEPKARLFLEKPANRDLHFKLELSEKGQDKENHQS